MVYILRFFPLKNAVCFKILTHLDPVLLIFYIQRVIKFKENNSGDKSLKCKWRMGLNLVFKGLIVKLNY